MCRRNYGTSVVLDQCSSTGELVATTSMPGIEADNGSIIFNSAGDLFEGANVFNPLTDNGPTWTVSMIIASYE